MKVAVAVGVGVKVAVGVAVGVTVGVAVGVGVGVGVGPQTVVDSTVLVSLVPLYPATTRRRFPIAVPPVKECATFVLGPVDQILLSVS